MSQAVHPNAIGIVRLMIVIGVFPVVMVYLFPDLGFVSAFLEGDRSQWLAFWMAAAAFEWSILLVVLVTYAAQRQPLRHIGFPIFGAGTLFAAIVVIGAAVWAALALPGVSDQTLARIPYGATLFLPPPDATARLFWVFMAFTAAACEEILFRGVAITELRRLTGSLWIAVLISSLAFAFFHGGVEQGAVMFAIRFVIALLLAGLFVWRGRLSSAMAVHFILDASALAAV